MLLPGPQCSAADDVAWQLLSDRDHQVCFLYLNVAMLPGANNVTHCSKNARQHNTVYWQYSLPILRPNALACNWLALLGRSCSSCHPGFEHRQARLPVTLGERIANYAVVPPASGRYACQAPTGRVVQGDSDCGAYRKFGQCRILFGQRCSSLLLQT